MAAAKKKVIKIEDENQINTLEAFSYEANSRRDLCASMIQMGIPATDPNFQAYHQEYQEHYVEYETAKAAFERQYVQPLVGEGKQLNWNLDFRTKELTIWGIE